MENKKEKKFSLFGKMSLGLFIVFAGFISWAIYKQVDKKTEIQSEIAKLEAQAEKINKENFLAQERIAYFESSDYQEREAKDKLNLKNPQENVVIVKQELAKKEVVGSADPEIVVAKKVSISNPTKWFNYFFKYE